MEEEVFVSLHDFLDVVIADRNFTVRTFFSQAFLQNFRRGLQVNHQIGDGELIMEMMIITVVNVQLLVSKVDVGENFIFFKNVVGDNQLLRTALHFQFLQLLETANHESELSLEGGAAISLIEGAKKCIVFGFDHALGTQSVSNNVGQRALADANRPFNGDITRWFKKLGHGFMVRADSAQDISATSRWQSTKRE